MPAIKLLESLDKFIKVVDILMVPIEVVVMLKKYPLKTAAYKLAPIAMESPQLKPWLFLKRSKRGLVMESGTKVSKGSTVSLLKKI